MALGYVRNANFGSENILSSQRFNTLPKPPVTSTYLVCKRILDIVGSVVLILLASPILLVTFGIVRLTSEGPAIFTQDRVGLKGQLFTIYKFRTMYVTAPKYGFHPQTKQDHRVTPIGYWLRRLSIDELPQLLNVLMGSMSLVGPRPEMPFIVTTYTDLQLRRLLVKPGLTGPWQISADRASPIHHNIHHDLFYLENASLILDLKLLFLTPLVLTVGKNYAL